ncbi:MAG: hypothetical protein AB7O26_10610 [Planctomycetaceae bacterium]
MIGSRVMKTSESTRSELLTAAKAPDRSCCAQNDRRARSRVAFTLLEVLLALGLSLLLLGALNLALDLYRQYTTIGRNDIEQAQLARAILQKMAADIRCAVAPPEKEGGSSGSTTSGGSSQGSGGQGGSSTGGTSGSETGATEFQIVDPSAAYAKDVVGVVGDLQTVVLTICRPTRAANLSPTAELTVAPPLSDMKSVSYFLATDGGEGLSGTVAEQYAELGGSAGLNGVRGLARLEGDRLSIAKADEMAQLDTLALRTKLIAPEVQSLQFRYSDGYEWFETWDGTISGLPRAIEVTIGIPDGEIKTSIYDDNTTQLVPYRIVVAIPSAEALAPETGL